MSTPPEATRAAARTLQRAGEWDTALALLSEHRGAAAAQLALAGHLPDGPERRMLREATRTTVDELGLTWLKRSL